MTPHFCLQERYSPQSACFGCGPVNAKGLRIRSMAAEPADVGPAAGLTVSCEWKPEPHHEAFPGVLNGGIVGALLDCHSNWAAAWALMNHAKENHPPCTVTAEYSIKL